METIAKVTAETITSAGYPKIGFVVGQRVSIIDRYERNGIKWIRVMLDSGPSKVLQEAFFDIQEVLETVTEPKGLEQVIQDLFECLPPDTQHTITVEACMNLNNETVIEQVRELICEYINNNCDAAIARLIGRVEEWERTKGLGASK